MTSTIIHREVLSFASLFWRWVVLVSPVSSSVAIDHICVCIPVEVTMYSPCHLLTLVPENTILCWSPSTTSVSITPSCFLTGRDSPVNTASAVSRLLTWRRYPSAGTLSHSSRMMTSHGTSSVESRERSDPSLSTLDLRLIIFFNDSIDFSALYSWINPKIALRTTIIIIITPSIICPIAIEMSVAMMRIIVSGLVNWLNNMIQGEIFFFSWSIFGPYWESLCCASMELSPWSVLWSCCKISVAVSWYWCIG